jgi:hypothetical protein
VILIPALFFHSLSRTAGASWHRTLQLSVHYLAIATSRYLSRSEVFIRRICGTKYTFDTYEDAGNRTQRTTWDDKGKATKIVKRIYTYKKKEEAKK